LRSRVAKTEDLQFAAFAPALRRVVAEPVLRSDASAQAGALSGAEDAQMSSRYRWLVARPVSHASPPAAEAPERLQKRSTNACFDIGRHPRGLAAHKHRGLFLQEVPHPVAIRRDRLLHIGFRFAWLAREGAHEFRHVRRLERAHLVLVEELLNGIAAAEKEKRLADRRALLLQRCAL
jgi:hypothetical protein